MLALKPKGNIKIQPTNAMKIKKARAFRPGPLGCEGEPQLYGETLLARASDIARAAKSVEHPAQVILMSILRYQKPAHRHAGRACFADFLSAIISHLPFSLASFVPHDMCFCAACMPRAKPGYSPIFALVVNQTAQGESVSQAFTETK